MGQRRPGYPTTVAEDLISGAILTTGGPDKGCRKVLVAPPVLRHTFQPVMESHSEILTFAAKAENDLNGIAPRAPASGSKRTE